MANLRRWILEMADGEPVEGVVIGEMGWGDFGKENVPNYDAMPKGVVLSWEEAEKWLDYDFGGRYKVLGCNAVWAWTKSWVIATGLYDGVIWPYRIPRHPTDMMPTMEGGG